MADPSATGPFEVPVGRLPDGRGQRRRAALGILTIVAVLGSAIGLARLADQPAALPSPSRVAAAPSAASAAPSLRPVTPRVERLLDAPNRALAGAPSVHLVEQHGTDLRVVDWTPGASLVVASTIQRAFAADPAAVPIIAPGEDRVALVSDSGDGGARGGRARIVDGDGTVIWSSADIAARSGALWSSDGNLTVLAGMGRTWHLVSVGDGKARDRPVTLPFDVFLPQPLPPGWLTFPGEDPRTVPLGFSGDGRWTYGGTVSPRLGSLLSSFRVAIDGSTVEAVRDLGVGRPDGLAPEPGTVGGHIVDPVNGRIATTRLDPDTTGRPPTLEIRNPDAGLAFVVDQTTLLGFEWDGSGGLVVLTADAPLFPDRVVLDLRDPNGDPGGPLIETGSVASAGLIGVRDGYAVLVVSAYRPDPASQLVIVDLADPTRIAAVRLDDELGNTILGATVRSMRRIGTAGS
jgi:hypothetical protein